MVTEIEALILEQLAAINKRLDKIETQLVRIAFVQQQTSSPIPSDRENWIQQIIEEGKRKREEEENLAAEIRSYSQKMPAELQPVPEQYKSRRRKKEVLALVKDPTRWKEIPTLSKQWYKPKRGKNL